MADLSSIFSLSLSLFSSPSNKISLYSLLYLLYSLLSPLASLSSKNAAALTTPKPMAGPPKHCRCSRQLQNPDGQNSSLAFSTCSLLSLNNFSNCVYGFWVVVVWWRLLCFCHWWLWVCYGYLARFG